MFELRAPLWNPYIGLGRPFLADVQPAVFYPPTYLVVFSGGVGLFVFLWLHMLLAARGMFALGRALGIGGALSCLLAFAFLICPGVTARLFSGQIVYSAGLCYVPLLFLLAIKLSDAWNWRLGAGFSLALAGQFLCGHPQVSWCTVIALGAFIVFRTPNVRTIGRFLLVCVWCAGLVAIVLLPFYESMGQGNRASNSRELAGYGALRWIDLAILVSDLGRDLNWEENFYIGLPATVLGIFGLILVRDKNMRGLWAVVLISILISLGPNSPVFNLLADWLPGYGGLRLHSRMAFMIAFALLLSGGIWLAKMQPRLITLAQTNFSLPEPLLFATLTLVLLAPMAIDDLHIKGQSLAKIMGVSPDFPFQWKVMEAFSREELWQPDQPPPLISVNPTLFPANLAMIHHVATYDAYTALFLKRPWDYLHGSLNIPDPGVFNSFVSPLVYRQAFPYPELPIVLAFDPAQMRLVRNPQPAARAFLVPTNSGTVKFLRYDCNSMVVETSSDSAADLVLKEAWYPGWRAKIGSATQDSFVTNGWMRGFHVAAGKHLVHIYFRQNYLGLGGAVSLLAFVLLIVGIRRGNGVRDATQSAGLPSEG